MSDGFSEMLGAARGFFAELAANNTRDWFEPRKDFYTNEIRKPAELLADLVAEDLYRLTGKAHAPKVFRIYRDVRFSKDKSPYNAHLHLLWSQAGRETAPAFFFGAAPDYTVMGCGMMGFQGARLTRYRAMIDSHGDEVAEAIGESAARIGARISDWGPAPLKRVPKPYDADHPHGDLLKLKSLILSADLPDGWDDKGVVAGIGTAAAGMMPFWTTVSEHFG